MTIDGKEYTTHTYQYGLAEIVVYRPVLTEEERVKAEAKVKMALERFGKEMVKKGLL